MKIQKQISFLVLAMGAGSILAGCSSSPPAEESKPVQAGDGSSKPVAAGAANAGGAAPSNASSTKAN